MSLRYTLVHFAICIVILTAIVHKQLEYRKVTLLMDTFLDSFYGTLMNISKSRRVCLPEIFPLGNA
jgi:hypothetical protein